MKTISIKSPGFTLIELMVVVAIIGIVSAIAYPSYDKYTKKTRRTDATDALVNLSSLETTYWSQNKFVYTDNLALLNFSNVSKKGYYDISVTKTDVPPSFIATATAVVGKVQENDTGCTVLTLSSAGAKTPAACW